MERRHENSLKSLLETVAYEGYASKAKWKIARWYGQTNFSVNIRRDLRNRWRLLLEEELNWPEIPTLRMAEVEGSIILMKEKSFFPDQE